MKQALILAVAMATVLAPAAQQAFTSGKWTLSYDGARLSLARSGKTLIQNVTFGYWNPNYKGMRFAEAGLSVRRDGDVVTLSKSTDQASAALVVTLTENAADFTLDATLHKAPGPFEYGFFLPVDSFRNPNGLPFARLGTTFFPIEETLFPTRGDRKLSFDLPEAHHEFENLGAGTFSLQDRRHVAGSKGLFRSVTYLPIDSPQTLRFHHVWRVKDDFDVETVHSRATTYSVPLVRSIPVMIKNPGFEDGPASWNLPKNAKLDATVAHSGKTSASLTVVDPMKEGVYITRRIPIEGGALYRADCFVKTENVMARKGRMESVGAGLIVEWSDKNGKWIAAGEYATGLFGTQDWQHKECNALKAPDDAGFAQIYLTLRGAGTAWFDDLSFTAIERAVDLHEPCANAVFANNTPLFSWEDISTAKCYTLQLSRKASFPADATQSYTIRGEPRHQLTEPLPPGTWYWKVTAPGAGKTTPRTFLQTAQQGQDCLPPEILTQARRVTHDHEPFTVQVRDAGALAPVVVFGAITGRCDVADVQGLRTVTFTAPAGGWARGFKTATLSATDAAGNRAERPFYFLNAPKPANDVVIDAEGNYSQSGTRIFPLGIYEVHPKEMEEVRACGFDVVHTYRWEGDQDDAACRTYLDACWAANGLRAFIGFDRGGHTGRGIVQGNFDHVARRVGALADHPGLFCWYLFDEPEILGQYVSPERLTAFADLIRVLDPYHPVVMTTWNKSMINYRRTWDTHWTQAYGDPAGVVRQIDEHRAFLHNASPITLLVNCNDGVQGAARRRGVKPDPEKFARDYDHLRACAFLGIVKECNGLWWWWFARNCTDYYTAAQCPKAWSDMKKILRELVEIRPLVTVPGPVKTGTAVDGKSKVEWWRKTVSGRNILIAVNTGTEPATVTIEGAKLAFRRHEVKVIR